MAGNSSSGIIEAASLGTPVLNVGPRQQGRERSANVTDVAWNSRAVQSAIKKLSSADWPFAFTGRNVYGGGNASERIAQVLATVALDDRLRSKVIRY